jgi:hypothetical protein
LKQISGQDDLSCRGLFKNQITFRSIGKLNLATNYVPKISGDKAVVDRARMIFFKQEFAKVLDPAKPWQKPVDCNFVNDIETIYLDEVFSWIVKGSKEYYKDKKITMPKSFADETARLIQQEDSIESFLQNKLIKTDNQKDIVSKNDMFQLYQAFCSKNSQRCQPRSTLWARLDHDKIQTYKLHGYDVYRGFKILDDQEVPHTVHTQPHGVMDKPQVDHIAQLDHGIKPSVNEVDELKKEIEALKEQLNTKPQKEPSFEDSDVYKLMLKVMNKKTSDDDRIVVKKTKPSTRSGQRLSETSFARTNPKGMQPKEIKKELILDFDNDDDDMFSDDECENMTHTEDDDCKTKQTKMVYIDNEIDDFPDEAPFSGNINIMDF